MTHSFIVRLLLRKSKIPDLSLSLSYCLPGVFLCSPHVPVPCFLLVRWFPLTSQKMPADNLVKIELLLYVNKCVDDWALDWHPTPGVFQPHTPHTPSVIPRQTLDPPGPG